MQKVDERVDLSRKVLDIDIESPVFNAMLKDANKEVQRVLKKVYDEEFDSGEITLKLNIEIPEAYKTIPKMNEFNEMVNETYKYRKPIFKHNVTTTFKKQYKQEGLYTEERDVKWEDGKFVAVPIKQAQMHMDDMGQ